MTQQELAERGRDRVSAFCRANRLPVPTITIVPREKWRVGACAYYRKDAIKICLEECARPALENQVRNWNWMGSTVDREPYGVLCHELGHHVDYYLSKNKGAYYGDYSLRIREKSGEEKLTNYCPNDAEFFAEMARLFITNAPLLKLVRPRTYALLRKDLTPVSGEDWVEELGPGVPGRIVASQKKKFARVPLWEGSHE